MNSPNVHTKRGQEPAYPVHKSNGQDAPQSLRGGLTKRELFAAMAMQGFAAFYGACGPHDSGEVAVKWADALIEALTDDEVRKP